MEQAEYENLCLSATRGVPGCACPFNFRLHYSGLDLLNQLFGREVQALRDD
jgi:hypothetical protein